MSRAAAPFALGTVAATAVTFNGVGAGNASGRSDGTITVAVPGGAATAPVVVTVNGVSSNGASFTVTPVPATTSVAPATGAAGTQVTTSGSGSGPAQGAGTVLLGSTYGSVVSWSGSQIVATVASNAQSGNAQVQRGGVWSNAVPFTVITPAISSVTPTSGLPGTPVTITASGFGAAQGNGQVWLGTANGVVQSWSDTQIVAQVGAGAASGNAQVLQNNVMSNRVAFTVNTPQLASISPASGVAGTSVTFTGSGFGASQGVVWLGSMAGQVVSWQDAQVVATVASGAVSGIARVQSGGGLWSNALGFTVPAPGGNTVVPSLLNMVVGDTHTIQALSAGGQSVTGLVWTSSDPTVVSLSTDDPPVLTAVAAGHVTITAGTGSADVTVWPGALGVGTAIWTNPGDGSGVQYIVPAVPSATGVADVFAFQGDGTVQAITSDGTTAWTADVSQVYGSYLEGGPYPGYIAPDFQGGLVGLVGNQAGPFSIVRWDGMTGQVAFTTPTPWLEDLAVHPDGTIFGVQYLDTFPAMGCSAPSEAIVGIDPTTGAQKFSVPVMAGNGGFSPGGMIVAGDGYAYWLYFYVPWPGCPYDGERAYLLRVDTSGAYDNMQIATGPFGDTFDYFQGYMITNADQGVLLSWQPDEFGYRMAVTTGTSVSVVNPPQVPGQCDGIPVQPVLQAQDGSFVGEYVDANTYKNDMVSFDAAGNVRWVVPNETPAIATADGGVIGASGITYDANGNATGQISDMPTQSWTGNAYQNDPGQTQQVLSKPTVVATTFWPGSAQSPPGANASGTPVAVQTAQVRLHVFKLNGTAQIDLTGIVEAAQKIWAKQSNGAIALLWDHSIQNTDPCATPGCVRGSLDDLLDLSSDDMNYWLQLKDFLQKFPDRQGINVVQNATLPKGNGITLNMPIAPAPQRDSTTLSNIIVLPNNTSKVLGHEVGHAFGLHHVSNPFNLMCGAPGDASDAVAFIDSFWCFEWTARSLNDDQLATAKAKALTLVEK